MDGYDKFDDVFMGILQNLGRIEPFLDAIFHFLARRTDFFRIMHTPTDKMGFPPGVSEKVVLKIFHNHQAIVLGKEKQEENIKAVVPKSKIQEQSSSSSTDSPTVVHHEEVVESAQPLKDETRKKHRKTKENTCNKLTSSTSRDSGHSVEAAPVAEDISPSVEDASVLPSSSNAPTANVPEETSPTTPAASTDTHVVTPSKDCFNGAVLKNYSFSQSLTDVDIRVPVPAGVRKSKDLTVDIKPTALHVALKDEPPQVSQFKSKILMTGELPFIVKCEESMWSLLPGDCVQINLEKHEHRWWTSVLVGDPKIDKQSIDTTQQVSEFDDQTQSDIRKVMYDQQQKRMGKPTSDEQKTYDMLEKGWNAEGSPFKGTPFDPSRVNISGAPNELASQLGS